MRHALGGLASLCVLAAAPTAALEFELADGVTLSMLNKVTIGAGIRTQDYHGKNLGILNVLPVPVLDGGHLFFFLIEGLRGRPLSVRVREMAQQVGVLLLVALMVFVVFNDISRIVAG